MSDLPAILRQENRQELLRKATEAGENHLSPAQTALKLGLSEKETQILMYNDPDVASAYAIAHLEQQIHHLKTVKEIANNSDPENKQRFPAAKYLYELFSGHKTSTTFNIAIQNNHPAAIRTESAIKLVDAVDADVIKDIEND
jgi:hypothetical protein